MKKPFKAGDKVIINPKSDFVNQAKGAEYGIVLDDWIDAKGWWYHIDWMAKGKVIYGNSYQFKNDFLVLEHNYKQMEFNF